MLHAHHGVADALEVTDPGLQHYKLRRWADRNFAGLCEEELDPWQVSWVIAILYIRRCLAVERASGDNSHDALFAEIVALRRKNNQRAGGQAL